MSSGLSQISGASRFWPVSIRECRFVFAVGVGEVGPGACRRATTEDNRQAIPVVESGDGRSVGIDDPEIE